MLSRVADALFWMSRYIERSEHVARMLDVSFNLELDLSAVVSGNYDLHWMGLLNAMQQPVTVVEHYPHLQRRDALMHWYTFDGNNPHSITSCVTRSRANARGVRGSIPNEVWKELNKLYWQLRDDDFKKRFTEAPSEYYGAVEEGSHAVQGMCDALMAHDEGWQFIQLGKFLERFFITVRFIDVHNELLRELTDPADLPLANLHWAGVLRCCAGYHAYQRMYVGRVEPARALELLLLNPGVPRSARFCLEAALKSLGDMYGEGMMRRRAESKCERLLGKALSDLRYADLNALSAKPDGLHVFLTDLLDRCTEASMALQEMYSV